MNISLDTSFPSVRIIRELAQLIEWRGKPEQIRMDNGSEFIVAKMSAWCKKNDIALIFIEKGKPSQNAYFERFNRMYRQEVLDAWSFDSLSQARKLTQARMWIYNNERPYSSLGHIPPVKFLEKRQVPGAFPTLQKDVDSTTYFQKGFSKVREAFSYNTYRPKI